MPTNKKALLRIKKIDELLSDIHHDYNLDDITNFVNDFLASKDLEPVTRRCIEKDIDYMVGDATFECPDLNHYSVASYDIEKQKDIIKHCLRYSDPSFSIFKKKMTDDEKYLLSQALELIGQFDGLPNFEALESLKRGLQVEEHPTFVKFTKNPIGENSTLFGEIFTAISQKQAIELHYHVFAAPEEEKMIIFYPYLLKEYSDRWYLIGAAASDMKILNFCLDRIDRVIALTAYPYIECEEDLEEKYEEIIGVTLYEDSPTYDIIFWVDDKEKAYVDTKPLHDSQKQLRKEDQALREKYQSLNGGAFYKIQCKYNYELIRELCSFGENLLVLDPKKIYDIIASRVVKMSERYILIKDI